MQAFALDLRFSDTPGEHRDLVTAALLDFETAAVHEIGDTEWRVFFRSREERDRAAALLAGTCDVTPADVEDEDWARRSQQDLKAIQVGHLIIAPPWDVPPVKQQEHPAEAGDLPPGDRESRHWHLAPTADPLQLIIIEPSTGFGTGHHATTRLCLRALQDLDLRGTRVLDVGTGSGVLAIAAAVLGALSVTAVDNDPDAIAAARDNVRRNAAHVDLRVVDLEHTRLQSADVVLANLTGAMLQRAAGTLAALARGGILIVSGLADEEEPAVAAAFAPYASAARREHESGWSSFIFTIP